MSGRILITSFFLFVIPGLRIYAQDTIYMDLGGQPVIAIIDGKDTLFSSTSELTPAIIEPKKRKAETRDLRQYRRLIYNVKKVYPYAKLAGSKYSQVIAHIDSLERGKDQREYIRLVENELLRDYEEELKELTITQGRILIKLIDRETSFTSYEVVKELRGGVQAAFWQAVARIFGSNLKAEFDPEGEDKMLNEIMIMIEKGQM
jgi:hypothetical protein